MNGADPVMQRLIESDPSIRSLFVEYTRWNRDETAKRAKADPRKYRLTTVMADGASTSYRYWRAGTDGRGRKVRFCWCVHRNAAGYFLGWREVEGKSTTKRDQFIARKTKAAAQEVARRRQNAWIERAEHEAKAVA